MKLTVKELKKRCSVWPETDIDGKPTYVYFNEVPVDLFHFNFRSNQDKTKHSADMDFREATEKAGPK